MKKISIICCALIIVSTTAGTAADNGLVKHALDKSVSRTLIFENRLKVLLVSDPDFNKSAASLDLAAGAFSDPRNRQGMAHFTEHMLFINTEKYPEVDAFNRFLSNNGGYRNGFTAYGNTNYHFEVHHDALEEALDRFAQFFVAPLFDSAYAEREMHAIDSEHKKNVMNDSRREHQLFRSYCKKGHPMNMFSTGDTGTLKGTGSRELKEFYKSHSSSNRMSLSVLGSKSLDELERMVRASFSAVPDNDLPPVSYDPEFLERKETVRLLRVEPVKDLRQLSVDFALPGILDYYESKPTRMLGAVIGHEGTGSLLSYLKERGWATGLGAGGYPFCSSFALFSISVSLTEKGAAEYDEVLKALFTGINLLKTAGIPQYMFDEAAAMARLDYANSDHGEGSSRATRLASDMNRYPLEHVQHVPYMFTKWDTAMERKLLECLTPDNMLCVLTARGVETDTTEQYYGTEYSYTEDMVLYKALLALPENDAIRLPSANPYIPEEIALLPERPVTLIDEKGAQLWYSQDIEFKRPKLRLEFNFQVPEKTVTKRHLVLLRYYTDCINEQLNELSYPASEAGLDYALSGNGRGVSVKVGGYDAAALQLLDSIAVQLKRITVNEVTFNGIKDRITRQLANAEQDAAYRVARTLARKIRKGTYYLPEEQLETARSITLDEIRAFTKSLYKQGHLWGLVHGNISADASIRAFRGVQGVLKAKPLAADGVFRQSVLEQPDTETLTFTDSLVTNNSSYWRFNLLGRDTPRLRAAAKVINNFIEPMVFTALRTNGQLGYIVHGGATQDLDQLYLIFLVQSADYDAAVLREKTAAFAGTLADSFGTLTGGEFTAIKTSVAEGLKEKPESINDRGKRLSMLAYEHDGDFGRRADELKALELLTHDDAAGILRKALAVGSARITDVMMFAAQHTAAMEGIDAITDINAFKAGRTYRHEDE